MPGIPQAPGARTDVLGNVPGSTHRQFGPDHMRNARSAKKRGGKKGKGKRKGGY